MAILRFNMLILVNVFFYFNTSSLNNHSYFKLVVSGRFPEQILFYVITREQYSYFSVNVTYIYACACLHILMDGSF